MEDQGYRSETYLANSLTDDGDCVDLASQTMILIFTHSAPTLPAILLWLVEAE
jgi:hypothetical protein